jgi:hypothetical protein
MKRSVVFLLAMALLTAIGIPSVMAQAVPSLDDFNAVPTLSTENRYGAGLFTSDVDDFISVNDYDPDIGAFLFLGGFSGNTFVDDTSPLPYGLDNNPGSYAVSAGFAKSFSQFYLGVYLGGNVVNASGNKTGDDSSSTATWNTNLAILVGLSRIGGLRLDLIMDDITDQTTRVNGKTIGSPNGNTSGEGIRVALRWGNTLGIGSQDVDVHATVGYKFPEYTLFTNATGGSKTRAWSNAQWLLNGGIAWGLNDISTLEADLTLGGDFGTLASGASSSSEPGGFGFAIDAGLANSVEPLSGLELAFKPTLGLAFYATDNDDITTSQQVVRPTTEAMSWFSLGLGFDAGIKARLPGKLDKFTLVTGLSFTIFEWAVETGYASDLQTAWTVDGVSWNREALTSNGTLGLGTVFAPIDNLSIGFGLNVLLDHLVQFDLVKMQVRTGDFFTDVSTNNPLTFDLTVSYKF